MYFIQVCDTAVAALKSLPITDATTTTRTRRGVDLVFESAYGGCTNILTVSLEIVVVAGQNQIFAHACITAGLMDMLLQSPTYKSGKHALYTLYDKLVDELVEEEEDMFDDGWSEDWKFQFTGYNVAEDYTVGGLQTTHNQCHWLRNGDRKQSDDACIACVTQALFLVSQ